MTLEQPALSRSDLDRAAERRTDDAWLAARWADPATRVLVVADGQVLVRREPNDAPALRLLAPREAPAGERLFLGVDDAGTAYFAVAADALPEGAAGTATFASAGLRELGAVLDDREAGLAVHAIALANWHRTHTHCARCGAPTAAVSAGHVRRCPRDGSDHFPRTDPAVIMSVVDPVGRVLLGHQPRWPERRFSTLAGFVEPGESLEQAVRREVHEETAVRVGAVTYLGSQPWPFPSSLMLAFRAQAETVNVAVDGEELSEARWFTRDELAAAVRDGGVLLPPPVSIARRLIEEWYAGPLAGD